MADATDGGGAPLVRDTPTFRAALAYARRGWPVFPVYQAREGHGTACTCGQRTCTDVGKHPRTRNGFRDATTDPAKIREWWRTWPDAGVAIATGAGLVVLDVDPQHGGDETLRALALDLGALPDTVEAITGGGGRHLYFRALAPIPSSIGKLGPGLDVRADGGYVIAAPSRHESGRAYAWEASGDPDDVTVQDLPAAWAERCAPSASTGSARAAEPAPEAFPAGQRNAGLFKLGRSLRAKGLHLDEVHAALVAANAARCVPPLTAGEVEEIAGKACTVAAGPSAAVRETTAARESRRDADERRTRAPEPPPPPRDPSWRDSLLRDHKGGIVRNFSNVTLCLRHAEPFATLRFNDMTQSPELRGLAVSDAELGRIREALERDPGIPTSADNLRMALLTVSEERRYHPVRHYLQGLAWDGSPRIAEIDRQILCTGDPLAETFLRAFLVGAVARAMQPGCKNDAALVFVGKQGARKSTFFKVLGDPWFSDTHFDITNKDAFLALASAWLHELGEIERVTSRRGSDEVKQFMSSATDKFRPPYGRAIVEVPRSCAIVGTTNQPQFLEDDTGSRRFYILTIPGDIDTDRLALWKDQIWAEAVELWAKGEPWHLKPEADRAREESAETYSLSDPWAALIVQHLARVKGDELTIEEILSGPLDIPPKERTKAHAMRAARIVRAAGWERRKARLSREPFCGAPVWTWFRPVSPTTPAPLRHPDDDTPDDTVPPF